METITKIETRYPECDRMGIVHHSVYPVWYEIARMEFFEKLGFSFDDMNSIGVNPAMVDLHLQYKAPATYPQTLEIKTAMGEYAPKKLELLYILSDESGAVLNTARTFHIWTGPDGRSYNIKDNLPGVYAKIAAAAGK